MNRMLIGMATLIMGMVGLGAVSIYSIVEFIEKFGLAHGLLVYALGLAMTIFGFIYFGVTVSEKP